MKRLVFFIYVFLIINIFKNALCGIDHTATGRIYNADSSIPANGDITFQAYITTRTGEKQTQSSPGADYSSGYWIINVGNFPTPWSVGEKLKVNATNITNGQTGSITMTLTSSDPDIASDLHLTPPPEPDIAVSPPSKNYGDVDVGSSSTQTFVVSNEGDASLSVSSTSLVGGDASHFSITSGGGSFTLSPGADRDVKVRFSPGSTGSKSATLRFANNDPDEDPKNVSLSGNGVAEPDIAVSPTSKNYGDVAVGSSSTKKFVVTNEGNANLSVTSTDLIGPDAAEFSITSGGGSFTLSPGNSRDVRVQFSPESVGSKSAILRFENNDPDEDPKDVSLTGNGVVVPDINVNPSSNDYGNVNVGSNSSKTFVVSNQGSADLSVTSTSLTGTDPGEFSITSGGGSFTLSPGSDRDVKVRFNPISIGEKSATLRFDNNDPDEDPKNVSLSGTGAAPDIAVNPGSKNYGEVEVGSSSSQTFEVTNEGNADLNVTSTSLEGADAGEFSITSGGGSFTLSPGASRDVNISFEPTSSGEKNATLHFASNDPDENPKDAALSGNGIVFPDIAVNPALKNYGDVTVGASSTQTFEVTNEGDGDLNVTATSLEGSDKTQFSILSGGGSFSLSPGASRNVDVRFNPTSVGPKNAVLRFASNDPDENPKDIELSGNGVAVPLPDIAVNPGAKNYGDIRVGSTSSQTFVVTNEGTADLNVTSTNLEGEDAEEFSLNSGGGSLTLIPGETRNINISFNPSSVGEKSAALHIESNDPDENPLDISLNGSGVIPDISVNPISKNYGEVLVGSSQQHTFIISNQGTENLDVTSTNLEGTDAGEFSLDSGGGTFIVAPGENHDIEVSFNPTSSGFKSAILRITSNDPDESPFDVSLSGNGIAPDISVDPASKNYGDVPVGLSESQTFTITNEGNITLSVTSTSLEGTSVAEFSLDSGAGSFTLDPGATHSIEVSFNPTAAGAKSASMRLQSNDPDENPLDVPLTGNGVTIPLPDITVNPNPKDYGNVKVSSSSTETFVVINTGTADLDVTSVSLEGPDAAEFSLDSGGGSFTLTPGETHNVEVSFNPVSYGTKSAILRFVSNDPNQNPLDVSLSGKGGDGLPPYLCNCYPPANALAVPKNTDIQLRVNDNGDGVNLATLEVKINETPIVSGGVDQTGGRVQITSHSPEYTVLYDPFLNFSEGSIVSVQVECQDMSSWANSLDSTYTFIIGTSPVIIIHRDTIDQNGGIIKDESTGIELNFPPGAVDDTTEIFISTIKNPPSLPDSVHGIGLFFHFGPDGLQFNDSVLVSIPYKQSDLNKAGITDPMDLPIYYFSTTKGKWIKLKIINADNDYVYVKIKEFCYLVVVKLIKTGIEEQKISAKIPENFSLRQNYPNPFNPETVIRYEILKPEYVKLKIYDINGRCIKTLVDGQHTSGVYQIMWNGINETDNQVHSGVYILKMKAGNIMKMIKMSLCK